MQNRFVQRIDGERRERILSVLRVESEMAGLGASRVRAYLHPAGAGGISVPVLSQIAAFEAVIHIDLRRLPHETDRAAIPIHESESGERVIARRPPTSLSAVYSSARVNRVRVERRVMGFNHAASGRRAMPLRGAEEIREAVVIGIAAGKSS